MKLTSSIDETLRSSGWVLCALFLAGWACFFIGGFDSALGDLGWATVLVSALLVIGWCTAVPVLLCVKKRFDRRTWPVIYINGLIATCACLLAWNMLT